MGTGNVYFRRSLREYFADADLNTGRDIAVLQVIFALNVKEHLIISLMELLMKR